MPSIGFGLGAVCTGCDSQRLCALISFREAVMVARGDFICASGRGRFYNNLYYGGVHEFGWIVFVKWLFCRTGDFGAGKIENSCTFC